MDTLIGQSVKSFPTIRSKKRFIYNVDADYTQKISSSDQNKTSLVLTRGEALHARNARKVTPWGIPPTIPGPPPYNLPRRPCRCRTRIQVALGRVIGPGRSFLCHRKGRKWRKSSWFAGGLYCPLSFEMRPSCQYRTSITVLTAD
jgi:hypothetical protein